MKYDVVFVNTSDIKPYEKNAKKHPAEQIERIKNSIREFGFKQNLVLDDNNVIIIGHGRFQAAKELEIPVLPCVYASDLTDEQIKALRLADNKVAESEWDFDLLDDELLGISDIDMSNFGFDFPDDDGSEIDKTDFEKLVCMGFDIDEISEMLYVDKESINKFCEKSYNICFRDLIEEIDYAKNINQDKERPYTVYMHIAPNGKKYIGITKCKLNKRWSNGKGYWSNKHFTSAINKYGWDKIKHAILYMRLTKKEAEEKEIELIKRFNTNDRRYGYNIESGGSLNKLVSEETRQKLRENATGVFPTVETRKKMSDSHKGSKCHFYGKHLSNEQKDNLRELKSKKVAQINDEGDIIKIYSSMKKAALVMNVTRQAISSCCNGKTKKCKGYTWRWL